MVEAYAVSGRVVLSALTPLDIAAWTPTDALVAVEDDAPVEELGRALIDMLEQSLAAPRSDGREADLLREARVRSYTQLVRTARYVSVSRRGDGPVLLAPCAGRSGGGWVTVGPEDAVVVDDPSPSALGAALLTAVERSVTTLLKR